jgi:4'-phosphopantetheinyl transferase
VDGPGAVEVHLVDLAAPAKQLAEAESCLTRDEVLRARRGTPAVHRRRVLVRAALRTALATELSTDPARVPLATTEFGRPYVAGRPELDVSCSASDRIGLVVVGRGRRVGVDVERVAPWTADALDEGWLAESERQALTALPPEERPTALTRCWTQKESVLKARGTGLLEPPSSVVTTVGRRAGTVAGWDVLDVPVPPGWTASLAVRVHEETTR